MESRSLWERAAGVRFSPSGQTTGGTLLENGRIVAVDDVGDNAHAVDIQRYSQVDTMRLCAAVTGEGQGNLCLPANVWSQGHGIEGHPLCASRIPLLTLSSGTDGSRPAPKVISRGIQKDLPT